MMNDGILFKFEKFSEKVPEEVAQEAREKVR